MQAHDGSRTYRRRPLTRSCHDDVELPRANSAGASASRHRDLRQPQSSTPSLVQASLFCQHWRRVFGGPRAPHEYVHDVQPPSIDEHADAAVIRIVEASASEREAFGRAGIHLRGKIDPSREPRFSSYGHPMRQLGSGWGAGPISGITISCCRPSARTILTKSATPQVTSTDSMQQAASAAACTRHSMASTGHARPVPCSRPSASRRLRFSDATQPCVFAPQSGNDGARAPDIAR